MFKHWKTCSLQNHLGLIAGEFPLTTLNPKQITEYEITHILGIRLHESSPGSVVKQRLPTHPSEDKIQLTNSLYKYFGWGDMNWLISIIVIIIISCCLLRLSFSKPSSTLRSPNSHVKSHPKFDGDSFCKQLGNTSRGRSTTGGTIFMALIARIYGQALPVIFEHLGESEIVGVLQQSPNLCNVFSEKELL